MNDKTPQEKKELKTFTIDDLRNSPNLGEARRIYQDSLKRARREDRKQVKREQQRIYVFLNRDKIEEQRRQYKERAKKRVKFLRDRWNAKNRYPDCVGKFFRYVDKQTKHVQVHQFKSLSIVKYKYHYERSQKTRWIRRYDELFEDYWRVLRGLKPLKQHVKRRKGDE